MIVRVHGSRGSHPVSTSPARIEEIQKNIWMMARENKAETWEDFRSFLSTQPRHLHQIFGGSTTCIEIETAHSPMPIFIDAGSGLTNASKDSQSALCKPNFLKGKGECAFFFTHTHWDHTSGLITIPQLYIDNNRYHFYGVHKDLRARIAGLFDERYFPVPFSLIESRLEFHQLALGKSLHLGSLKIDHHPQSHPGGSFAYRFSDGKYTFVVATDTDLRNTTPPHLETGNNIYSNADVLVVDAHFSPEDFVNKEDFGHAHLEQAIDFGVREKAKLLYLFHQSPFYSDKEIQHQLDRAWDYVKKKHPQSRSEIRMAIDGDVLDLGKI
jgi:phosphoribosyl 1,2-cyclic phosphodiesterase